MLLNADKMATVASANSPTKEEVMALFKVTVKAYKDKRRPWFNWVVNTYHPSRGRSRSVHRTKAEPEKPRVASCLARQSRNLAR